MSRYIHHFMCHLAKKDMAYLENFHSQLAWNDVNPVHEEVKLEEPIRICKERKTRKLN